MLLHHFADYHTGCLTINSTLADEVDHMPTQTADDVQSELSLAPLLCLYNSTHGDDS